MRTCKESAYAKINLYLDVVARRDDGFHDIKTVMHSLSLCDRVSVSASPSKKPQVRIVVSGNKYVPTDSRNLAVRAAQLYIERAMITSDVTIRLEKNIPIAAGLAGGSSDAAAVLRAMNRLFNRTFTERALSLLATELGSDVPYCLYGKTALCEGRGEIITKLPDSLKLHTVVAIGGEHISTPTAYARLDELYSGFDGTRKTDGESHYSKLEEALSSGRLNADCLYNVFEDAVLPSCPDAVKIKETLLLLGASAAMMSGSGPSVFGVFDCEAAARRAEAELLRLGFYSRYASSV